MKDINQLPVFFICANSADGFVSKLADCYDPQAGWRVYVIKGGPGTGKSTMMKRIALQMAQKGVAIQLIACTGDPESLDGVVLPDKKAVILDGTAPHVVEPKYVGACESIVDIGVAFDVAVLDKARAQIMEYSRQNSALHASAAKYIVAAGTLLREAQAALFPAADVGKAAAFGARLAKKYLPRTQGQASEQIRFLSGVTCKGHIFYRSTLQKLCDDVVVISDEHGLVASTILAQVRRIALERGYSIITCPCPMFPNERVEHVLIPALRLGFCTENKYLKPEGSRRIHARRFMQPSLLHQHRQKAGLTRRTVKELLAAASARMSEAKQVHDRLEQCYIPAVDFKKIDALTEKLLHAIDAL